MVILEEQSILLMSSTFTLFRQPHPGIFPKKRIFVLEL